MTLFDLDGKDLQIDSYDPHKAERGGMVAGVSAGVKVTHIPTGCIVACTIHRNQNLNRITALSLMDLMLEDADA
jgi:protein subunit release factor A